MGRVELGENGNLLLNVLDLVLCALEVDNLDCDSLLGALVVALIDLSKGSLAYGSISGGIGERYDLPILS